ncbi:TPA: hypothetical protein N0F65_001179 [Lagenidium giganteum]|uniref:G-protein coupled receptors family 2 profile 2 domain-containing protein n=1 Tax=Lagenidium giganteum TaxID=4803 RepID=A0AAV2Z5S1_9STRA|nr:TPA: hypothetical protein N0F65_001179 [Lagenidium giganteum]
MANSNSTTARTIAQQLNATNTEFETAQWLIGVSSSCSIAGSLTMILCFVFFQESRRCGRRIMFCLHVADLGAACAWLLTLWLPEIDVGAMKGSAAEGARKAATLAEGSTLCVTQVRDLHAKIVRIMCAQILIHCEDVNLGYLLMFFMLASYLWTGCFAFHLYQMLGRRFQAPELFEHRYHIVAWGLPAMFVVHFGVHQALGFHLMGPSGRPWCWMRLYSEYSWSKAGFWLQMIFFYAPVLFIFVHNIITYVWLLYKLGDLLSTKLEGRIWRRMLGYGVVFFVSIVWAMFALIYEAISPEHTLHRNMLYCMAWFAPFQGAMNAVAYGLNHKVKLHDLVPRAMPNLRCGCVVVAASSCGQLRHQLAETLAPLFLPHTTCIVLYHRGLCNSETHLQHKIPLWVNFRGLLPLCNASWNLQVKEVCDSALRLRCVSRQWNYVFPWLQADRMHPVKSVYNMKSKRYRHDWQQFMRRESQAFLQAMLAHLPKSTKEDTNTLKRALCESTNTGVRPSFDNHHARSGYIAQKFNRVGNLPNLLLSETLGDLRAVLLTKNVCRFAMYGGGPGYDTIGMVLLRQYLRLADFTIHGVVYDNEPGWTSAVTAVQHVLQQHHDHASNATIAFKSCDITLDIHDSINADVVADVGSTQLFLFPFVCVENYQLLRQSNFQFLRSLFDQAPLDSVFIFTDSTHRLWPEIWDVACATTHSFRIWTPFVRSCHYALVLQKLPAHASPTQFSFYTEAMAALARFRHHHSLTMTTVQERYGKTVEDILAIDNPEVTSLMVNALSDDEVCALFIAQITRLAGQDLSETAVLDGPSDKPTTGLVEVSEREADQVTDGLLTSYRATMLLTNDDSADALITFLGNKAKLITKCIFPIFQRNSQGNLRHGCRVIDHLLRFHLDDVYEVLGRNAATVKRYMGVMLNYIDLAPVAEVFLTLVCKPHNAALLRYYACTPQKKWSFFRALSEWKLLLVLAEHVSSSKYTEQHTIGAGDVFVELLDRLAADENGSLLLQPAAYCPELLEGLVTAAVDKKVQRTMGQRTAAMKCVLRLLQKSSLEKVQGPPTSPYQSFGATIVNLVPNQLAPLRERIYELTEKHMGKMLQYLLDKYQDQQNILMDLESDKPLPDGAVRHTSYVVKAPFTEFRLTLVEALVELVSHNPQKMGEHFDVNVWRVLTSWFFEYAHNNLYHAAFYQLVFIALRTDNQASLEVLVKKLKLVTSLIEHYRDESHSTSNKGYILQTCNAIRLQAASQSPDAFLRNFLQSHTTWRQFEPELREHTNLACVNGLGFNVPQAMRPGYQEDTWQMIDEERGIDHGSEYAKSLGFVDDVAWPEEDVSEVSKKKKKKGKKGKKAASTNGDADHEDAIDDNGTDDGQSEPSEQTITSTNGSSDGAKKPKSKKKKNKKK